MEWIAVLVPEANSIVPQTNVRLMIPNTLAC